MVYKYCPKCGHKYGKQKELNKFACSVCRHYFYVNSQPTASTIIVKDNKVLLGKRKIEPGKGKWDVIGGFLELGEHPEAGAKREVKEETGLEVAIKKLVGIFMDTYSTTGDKTLNIFYAAEITGGNLKPGDDIKELKWFAINELPQDMAFQSGKAILAAWLKSNHHQD